MLRRGSKNPNNSGLGYSVDLTRNRWRKDGAMGSGQGVSLFRWDAEGSQASPSAGPITRWASQGPGAEGSSSWSLRQQKLAQDVWIRRGEPWVG